MLGTLEDNQKSDWKAHVPTLVHAYNCTQHDSTGYSPYYLMFGRHPRLAIDAFLGLRPDEMHATRSSEYIRKLSDRLDKAYAEATKEAKKSAKKQKRVYDKNVRSSLLHPGDRVLLRNVSIRGKHETGGQNGNGNRISSSANPSQGYPCTRSSVSMHVPAS